MAGTRMVATALRCYPARWRRRHGDEAAELAALLIGDGSRAGSIAWNYLVGAAREWLTPRPRTVAAALVAAVCSLGLAAGVLASTSPARAASTSHGLAASTSHARAASTSHASEYASCAVRPGPYRIPVQIRTQEIPLDRAC